MPRSVNADFEFLLNGRSSKPRDAGLTMIEGDGPFNVAGMSYVEDLLACSGEWVDLYKFQRGAFALQPPEMLHAKLDLLTEHDTIAFPGGIPMEAAILQDQVEVYLDRLDAHGFSGVEVSATAADIGIDRRADIMSTASERGFYVISEVGKKSTETGGESIAIGETVEEITTYLDAGADIVIFEMEEIESKIMGGEDQRAEAGDDIQRVIDQVGQDNLLFELPFASYFDLMDISWWFIDNFGNEVNLGNVRPEHVVPLEQQRRGLGQYSFRKNRT